jgi:hypothetical protein
MHVATGHIVYAYIRQGSSLQMCDNGSAVTALGTPFVNDMSRYAAINAHHVREQVGLEEFKIISVSADVMLADCMTKALDSRQACQRVQDALCRKRGKLHEASRGSVVNPWYSCKACMLH